MSGEYICPEFDICKDNDKKTNQNNDKKQNTIADKTEHRKITGNRRKRIQTPYDDAFRSLIEKCHKATIFLINEMFRETGYFEEYDGTEKIELLANESFGQLRTDNADKRITDSHIRVIGKNGIRDFHLECQSNPEREILIRMFEYDMRMARDNSRLEGKRLIVDMPCSAVLYLRSSDDTANEMKVEIRTPEGSIEYVVPVLQICNYGVNAIMKRQLYFLIPFYSFTICKSFAELDSNSLKLHNHLTELERLLNFLLESVEEDKLSLYEASEISDALQYVESFLIPDRCKTLKREVTEYMNGKVIEFRTDRVLKQGIKLGRQEGLQEGLREGRLETARSMFAQGVSFAIVRKCIDATITDEELQRIENGQLVQMDDQLQG